MAAVETYKEIKWMRNILIEFRYFYSYVLTFFIDNKSNIIVSKNLEYYEHIKHIYL